MDNYIAQAIGGILGGVTVIIIQIALYAGIIYIFYRLIKRLVTFGIDYYFQKKSAYDNSRQRNDKPTYEEWLAQREKEQK